MSRQTRDLIYRIFIICNILATIILALPLVCQPVLPLWAQKPVDFYLSKYNDPIVGGKSFPGGWFGGLSVCEVFLHLPYFLWAVTIPVGDKRLELPTLAYSVQALTAVLAVTCELFAFPERIVSNSDKFKLGTIYVPFQMILWVMAVDMYKRVRTRVQGLKKD